MKKNDLSEFYALKERLEEAQKRKDEFYEYALKQISLRFLSRVIPLTPTSENKTITYKAGGREVTKTLRGGALKRGWIGLVDDPGPEPSAAEIAQYVGGLKVTPQGLSYSITLANRVDYAPYVEYGHRQRPGQYVPQIGKTLVNAWVPGQHMMQQAQREVGRMIPTLYGKLFNEWMTEILNG